MPGRHKKLFLETFNEGIAVMPGSSFGLNGKNLIRLSLTVPDNKLEKACERIDEFVRNIV